MHFATVSGEVGFVAGRWCGDVSCWSSINFYHRIQESTLRVKKGPDICKSYCKSADLSENCWFDCLCMVRLPEKHFELTICAGQAALAIPFNQPTNLT